MKTEDVKQWDCRDGKAVAVNPYSQKLKVFNRFGGFDGIANSQKWKEFEDWRLNPANQPVTGLDGIFNSEQVKPVWQRCMSFGDNMQPTERGWQDCEEWQAMEDILNGWPTRRRLIPAESALCNTDTSPEVVIYKPKSIGYKNGTTSIEIKPFENDFKKAIIKISTGATDCQMTFYADNYLIKKIVDNLNQYL